MPQPKKKISPPSARSPQTIRIGKRDNHFQRLEVIIRNREKRGRYREFLVEGLLPLERVVKFGWTIKGWVYSSRRGLTQRATTLISAAASAPHFDVSQELLAELSDRELTSELLAVVEIPDDSPQRIRVSENPFFVVFDRPQNPGNLGTNIRTCDALGIDTAFIIGHAVDLYDPETVRATVGSLFAVPVVRRPSWDSVVTDLETRGMTDLQFVGTSAHGTFTPSECDFTKPTVLLVGNERSGLSSALTEAANVMVTIPQQGSATSLNVSCATSILLYEVQRQRRAQ